ncbi:MAG: TPM domain-containing protein, partial [Chitinophagaceae bacterium]
MKKSLLILLSLILSVCVFAQIEKSIPAKPSPPKLVNDFTGNFLTPSQKEALENKLKVYDDSTSNQFTIVIVPSLDGNEPNEYAVALGRKWGVGNKDFNNGLVILISTGADGEKRKAYIATGYGLEGAIPDVTCKRIVDNEIIPNFKEGNYYRGLDAATDALIKAAAGEYKAPANYGSKRKSKLPIGTIIFIAIILLVIFGGGAASGGGTYV